MKNVQHIELKNFTTETGYFYPRFSLSYQHFGQNPEEAPVVLVNHALTGNSNVAGDGGWWRDLIGLGRLIDTNKYAVLAFNIPGNGFDGIEENRIDNYEDFTARDIGRLFGQGLQSIGIEQLYAVIGGSLGGGIAWEMAVLFPDMIEKIDEQLQNPNPDHQKEKLEKFLQEPAKYEVFDLGVLSKKKNFLQANCKER